MDGENGQIVKLECLPEENLINSDMREENLINSDMVEVIIKEEPVNNGISIKGSKLAALHILNKKKKSSKKDKFSKSSKKDKLSKSSKKDKSSKSSKKDKSSKSSKEDELSNNHNNPTNDDLSNNMDNSFVEPWLFQLNNAREQFDLKMARRRPSSAPLCIIDPMEVISTADLTNKHILLRDLHQITANTQATIQWLARFGLIHNTMQCCNQPMGIVSRERISDGKAWYCKGCKSYITIRRDSFFSGSHISLPRILELMYWWAKIDCKQSVVMEEIGIQTETIVNWYNYFRDICAMYIIDHPLMLGGVGVAVEIYETKFMHRNYHRGHYRQGHWALGLVERGSSNCVLIPVPDLSAATLIPLINDHVLPGTRIITNNWAAYNALANRVLVNHSLNFVDPNDPTIYTNGVKGNTKSKYRAMHGTSDALWRTYLQEFIRKHSDNVFMNLIYWIRHYYNVN